MSNKVEDKNRTSNSTERKVEQVAEKLIMEELLNADDFITLLEATQKEFKRTFGIMSKDNEKETGSER